VRGFCIWSCIISIDKLEIFEEAYPLHYSSLFAVIPVCADIVCHKKSIKPPKYFFV